MHYVVLDLEWNQAMSSKSSVFNKLPFHLRGEIIQIGAVKLTEQMEPGEEFQVDVRPVYFRKMHSKVKKLTGFDKERLENGLGFVEAMDQFRAWCGDGCTFLTWGYDDRGILEQNIMLHDLDWDWIADWVNLQLIYSLQTEGDKAQKALSAAMEHFAIEQTRTAHDALGDAYNTALVCSHLDMETGLEQYKDAQKLLALRAERRAERRAASAQRPEPLEQRSFGDYRERAAVFADTEVTAPPCPVCGGPMEASRWVNQGDHRYMALAGCPEHGTFLIRLKLRQDALGGWSASRLLYRADDELEHYYQEKASSRRRRSRKHRGARKKRKVPTLEA